MSFINYSVISRDEVKATFHLMGSSINNKSTTAVQLSRSIRQFQPLLCLVFPRGLLHRTSHNCGVDLLFCKWIYPGSDVYLVSVILRPISDFLSASGFGIVTTLRAGLTWVRIQIEVRGFHFLVNVRTISEAYPSSYSMGTRFSFHL